MRTRIEPTLGLSDWSKTIVYCDGKLVLKSFKDYSSYAEFKEKIKLDDIMHLKTIFSRKALYLLS